MSIESTLENISSPTELEINAYLTEEMKSVLEVFNIHCAI